MYEMPMTILQPADNRFQAILLKAHLRLFAAGMKNSRISGATMLKKATALTGNAYRRGEYTKAACDLQDLIEQDRAEGEVK
jgi:hypothetical protein